MKNCLTRDFLENLLNGDGWVRYQGKDYFFNGCRCVTDEKGIIVVFLEIYDMSTRKDDNDIHIQEATPQDCIEAMLKMPFFNGKTFWEVENEIEWTDGPENNECESNTITS